MRRNARMSWVSRALVLFCCANKVFSAKNQSISKLTALISVNVPESVVGTYPGLYATFSQLPPPVEDLVAWVPPGDPEGCEEDLPAAPSVGGSGVVAFLRRGTCAFVEKAMRAQKAGAKGLVIVSDSEMVQAMGSGNLTSEALAVDIFVVAIRKSLGDDIIKAASQDPSTAVKMNFSIYQPSAMNLSELILICLATSLVCAGAFFATADMRVGSPLAPRPHEEVLEVETEMAFGFCFMGSGMLIVLFFFMKYMIYFIIFAFCVGGFSCISAISSSGLSYMVPSTKHRIVNVPLIGPLSTADLVASIPASILVVSWLLLRNTPYGWPMQDIIGAGFLCWMQRTLRLPNIKVATVLLSVMFFFDIFWVFLSPLIFQRSVMVTVAQGGGTGESVPMLLRIPAIGDPLGNDRMLGFGDIAIPGLLVSCLRRHDILSKRTGCDGYFVPSVIGYFCGLCVTIVALTIMQMGQPALLYLVPGTLGTTLVLGAVRREIPDLWNGTPSSVGNNQCERQEENQVLTDEQRADRP